MSAYLSSVALLNEHHDRATRPAWFTRIRRCTEAVQLVRQRKANLIPTSWHSAVLLEAASLRLSCCRLSLPNATTSPHYEAPTLPTL